MSEQDRRRLKPQFPEQFEKSTSGSTFDREPGLLSLWTSDLARYRRKENQSMPMLFMYHSLLNPGFQFTMSLRLQRSLRRLPVIGSVLSKLLWYSTTMLFSSDVNLNAKFGSGLYTPHPFGIVIGGNAWIGKDCSILHGVTIGRLAQDDLSDPMIGDGCFIGCNATLLGNIQIGNGCIVGANSLVISDLQPGYRALGNKVLPPKTTDG